MKRTALLISCLAVVSLLGDAVAQDTEPAPTPAPRPVPGDGTKTGPAKPGPAPPAPEKPAPPKPPAKSDPVALELLRAAAKHQGAEALAAKGALQSFHVGFARAFIQRERVKKDGSRTTTGGDVDRLAIDWMAPNNLREQFEADGRLTVRGRYQKGKRRIDWASDGETHKVLSPEDKKDQFSLEQIDRNERMIRELLDVAFLSRLLEDGSAWRTSKAAYPITDKKDETRVADADSLQAVTRRRLSEADPRIPLTLWIDRTSHEVRAAQVDMGADKHPFTYGLSYHDKFPVVTGATSRFPFAIYVYDQPGAKPIMQLHVAEVFINDSTKVNQATFAPRSK